MRYAFLNDDNVVVATAEEVWTPLGLPENIVIDFSGRVDIGWVYCDGVFSPYRKKIPECHGNRDSKRRKRRLLAREKCIDLVSL